MSNGFETFLSAVGKGFKTVFGWLGSAEGQKTVAGVEAAAAEIATAVNPGIGAAVVGIESLVNAGMRQAISIESLAAAASEQSGTGAKKAAAVTSAIAANAGAFLQSIGVKDATADEVQNLATVIATASADILNAIPARALGATAPAV